MSIFSGFTQNSNRLLYLKYSGYEFILVIELKQILNNGE